MISEVRVFSRWQMNDIAENPHMFPFLGNNWGLISIYTGGTSPLLASDEYLTPETRKKLEEIHCLYMLSLDFWDITDENYERVTQRYPEAILFNEDHAKQIINVIKEMQRDERCMFCIVHCDAGISRSGAVGEIVNDFCHLDYMKFRKDNPNIRPNTFIRRELRRISGLCPYSDTNRFGPFSD